ncbi:MAG: DUF1304 family protein [Gammaproteobacteria bacterium]|nr:DUF1304 family protein [Gammaproteobacteria bacterium]
MIALLSDFVVALVALIHLGFMSLEMFLWDKPPGLKVFRLTPEQAAATRVLAANQGLYNGFLAAGAYASDIKIFFLSCVIIAGAYGAITATHRILAVQAAPAALGLVLVLLS